MARTVVVVIEIPVGGGVRLQRAQAAPEMQSFPGPDEIPALAISAYGYVPGTFNPADSSELDAHVIGADDLLVGDEVDVRVLGARVRNDGDDKLLTAPLTHPLSRVRDLDALPPGALSLVGRWAEREERPGEHWVGADAAEAMLDRLRVGAR